MKSGAPATGAEINGFLVRETGMTFDEVYRLSMWEKMLALGYKPQFDVKKLYNPADLAKPESEKRPFPGLKAKKS